MQGFDLNGRKINVEFSKRAAPREPTPGSTSLSQVGTQARSVLLQCASRISDRILGHRVVLTSDIGTIMRSDADMRDLDHDLDLTHTEDADPATPDHLADDMYTSPTPT